MQAIEAIKEAKVCCTAAIKEAEVCCATAACILQQTHRENMITLEHEVKEKEGQVHKAFVEAFGAALQACLPKRWGNNVPPPTPDWNVGYHPAGSHIGQKTSTSSLHSNCIGDASTTRGAKCWHHSSDLKQEEEETVEPDYTTEEHPH